MAAIPDARSPLEHWLDYIDRVHPKTIELGLARLRRVAARLPAWPAQWHIITVAGTNGKGSTVIAMEQLLLAAGYRVGGTLSPHLEYFEERIRIQGEPAPAESIVAAFAEVEAARDDEPLTYFEYAALAALRCFAATRREVVLLEIGLGGRLDAFNLLDAHTAVITSIGLDHQAWLGETRSAIGREKAGILRPRQRLCLGPDLPASVHERARELALTPLTVDDNLRLERLGQRWQVRASGEGWSSPEFSAGGFVPANCALAIAAVWPLLRERGEAPADLGAWSRALQLAGRRETLSLDGQEWVLDVSHNPHAAAALAAWLAERDEPAPRVAVFGSLEDKDSAGVAAALAPGIDHWVLVPTAGPRGLAAQALAQRVPFTAPVSRATSVAQGLRIARALAGQHTPVLVFGAFAVVSSARQALGLGGARAAGEGASGAARDP
ncbi:MAG: bifunctional tetrahydrofolate synthase/dihydrofolate synthase [Pseudomonadota bacterium]